MSDHLFIQLVYKANLHDIYKLLKSSEIDIHRSTDTRGMSALHIACLNGNTSVIKFLLEYSKKVYNSPEILQN
jgi:Ankyrin repeat.